MDVQEHIVETKACGPLKVFTQGAPRTTNVVVILTVHDLGVNHNEYVDFLKKDDMIFLSSKLHWIHVEMPGQGDNDEDLSADYEFPSLDNIVESLVDVCMHFKVAACVLFGEGAGANILARFAMLRDDLTLGAVLVHCNGSTAGFIESIRDKFASHKLNTQGMNPKTESYLLCHRFGTVKEDPEEHELRHALKSFKESLRTHINPKNLNQYIHAYMNRSNLTDRIQDLKCPVLFMTGSFSSHQQTTSSLYNALRNQLKDKPDKRDKVEYISIDDIANPIRERPEKVAESLLFFLQGLGLAGGLMTRRMSNVMAQQAMFQRRPSMEESDKPIGVENLTYSPDRKYSTAQDSMQADIAKLLATRGDK